MAIANFKFQVQYAIDILKVSFEIHITVTIMNFQVENEF